MLHRTRFEGAFGPTLSGIEPAEYVERLKELTVFGAAASWRFASEGVFFFAQAFIISGKKNRI